MNDDALGANKERDVRVTLRLFPLPDQTGGSAGGDKREREIWVAKGTTLEDIAAQVGMAHDGQHIGFLLNGSQARPGTAIETDAVLAIFPQVAGG